MHILHFAMGLIILPVAILLTAIFFILLAASRTEARFLRIFGYLVAVFLGCAVVLTFVIGFYALSKGRDMPRPMLQERPSQQRLMNR